jgi:hypothetical protein
LARGVPELWGGESSPQAGLPAGSTAEAGPQAEALPYRASTDEFEDAIVGRI